MITKKVIDELYKKFRKRPPGVEHLDVGVLFEFVSQHHDVAIDDAGRLVIGSIDERSPFHKIELARVHAIFKFDDVVAIVLHSSIIFLNIKDNGVNVHVKFQKPSLWERLRWRLGI